MFFAALLVVPQGVWSVDWKPLTDGQSGELTDKMEPFKNVRKKAPEAAPAAAGRRLVCIDPGHPSLSSKGDRRLNGTTEVKINWQVALRLRDALKARGVEVMMTKTSLGELVDNRDRALMMNRAAEVFREGDESAVALTVHLHCDDDGSRKGFAVYFPDREGRYTGVTGREPDNGFVGPGEGVRRASKRLAEAVRASMATRLRGRLNDLGVMSDFETDVGGRQGALTFSIFSKIPTVTIEMVQLANEDDAKFIKGEKGQKDMAEAIAAGLLAY